MGTNKRVHKYYDKMHDILQRKGYYQIPNDFLMSIFIGGLYHVSRKQPLLHMCMLMREQNRLENELVIYADNTYSNNPIMMPSSILIIINILSPMHL